MKSDIIQATYPGGEYPIYINKGLLDQPELIRQHVKGKQVMIVTNDTVAPLYLKKITRAFNEIQCNHIVLPDGEAHKTLNEMSHIIDALVANHHHRDTTLIALGGGVIGDMTGFAAACFQRGVDFIQIPTTLLSQVDASIGGKTAVNHPQGKNLIGAFHQPNAVIIDINTLNTLPDREFRAGTAEIIKAALIKDPEFFIWLENNIDALLKHDVTALTHAIRQSCVIKRDIVAIDEKEQGVRALLNLGHTFGHALEQHFGYGAWLHGEAVAAGMVMAADLSHQLGWIDKAALTQIIKLVERASLPIKLPKDTNLEAIFTNMHGDKKVINHELRLVLLQGIGRGVIASDIKEELIRDTLKRSLAH